MVAPETIFIFKKATVMPKFGKKLKPGPNFIKIFPFCIHKKTIHDIVCDTASNF